MADFTSRNFPSHSRHSRPLQNLRDPLSNLRATYRGVFLNRSSCWYCDRPLGETYTSVESRTGFPLFVHFHCQPDAESITWPGRFACASST